MTHLISNQIGANVMKIVVFAECIYTNSMIFYSFEKYCTNKLASDIGVMIMSITWQKMVTKSG